MKTNYKISFYQIMWLYTVGAFLGFIGETLFHLYSHNELSNMQGMVYGPFKPLYGLGAVLMYIIYKNIKTKKYILIILSGIIIGTLYEYGVSLFEEYIFGYNTWLYPNGPLVLNKRVYLPYCLIWGIVIFLYYLAIPYIKRIFNYCKNINYFNKISLIVCLLMSINIILTVTIATRYVDRQNGIEAKTTLGNTIDIIYDDNFVKKHLPLIKVKK